MLSETRTQSPREGPAAFGVLVVLPVCTPTDPQANLRILGIESVRTVPYVPVSNPFVERLIGTVRREYLDQLFFWNAADLEEKLSSFKDYCNQARVRQGLAGITPNQAAAVPPPPRASLHHYDWRSYCNGLFELPIAA